MTILSKAPGSGAASSEDSSSSDLITVQCDVCCPPFIATNTLTMLHRAGWATVPGGGAVDICHICRRRLRAVDLLPRALTLNKKGPAGVGTLPNFVVIGAAKCATSSLHTYLNSHPDIAMTAIKELQFFQDPDCLDWLDFYKAQFDPTHPVRGESSTVYTRYPVVPGVAERMASLVPTAKLIYMVRDPVERAVSSYVEERMHSNDERSFEEAFSDLKNPFNPYVAASRYAMQLQRFRAAFSADQVLVVDMDDLGERPVETVQSILTFLGLDPAVEGLDLHSRLNTRADKREYPAGVRRLRSSPMLRALYRLPEGPREMVLSPVRRMLSTRLERPIMSDAIRSELEQELAADAAEFRRLTGRAFSHWSV